MEIISGKIQGAKKVVLYGPEGIGKSTFASCFPNPLFIDTEGSTKSMDVRRFDAPQKWEEIFEAVNYVLGHPDVCKTLVIDTADWAEMMCIAFTCKKGGVNGIEDFGYGKGYTYLQENFKKLLDKLDAVLVAGINVVVLAHAKMRKFEQPDEMGAYDRWEMKLSRQVAPMLKEWADMVLFANYKTFVVEDDKTKSKKAQGGKRVMYAAHNPCWDAKNRDGLPDSMDFDYKNIKQVIEPESSPLSPEAEEAKKDEVEISPELLKLRVLIAEAGIDEGTVMYACSNKGAYPHGTKLEAYDPEFIQKNLIDKWDGFSKYAKKLDKELAELPFN